MRVLSVSVRMVCCSVVALSAGLMIGEASAAQPDVSMTLPSVPVPPENPITEEKRILGKILFWDEQLSSDNTMACGTCHINTSAGADPRFNINPGIDNIFGTSDDIAGSLGVVASDANDDYESNPVFGLNKQVTGRAANPTINAAYAFDLFWDGRALTQFTDPMTGVVAIASGGGLESQAVGPPTSTAEMSHADRDWVTISAKIANSRPLALATDLTPDMVAALAANPTYADLFTNAFGDPTINSQRIAFAIATYERTLIADQTPWDDFMAGNNSAMTPMQIQGWNIFQNVGCAFCHTPPLFTDQAFRNIGLRPLLEDIGHEAVTGNPADRAKFKVPTLRNNGLKRTFMHNGQFDDVQQAVAFYVGPQPFPGNLDPFMAAVTINGMQVTPVTEFIRNGLTDPRVAAGTFPFDRPTLRSELPANPALITAGDDNGTGTIPTMIANVPPNAGNAGFKVGVTDVAEGASFTLNISSTPPVAGVITPDSTIGPLTATAGSGAAPAATAHWPIPDDPALDGTIVYFQWVDDATGALSPVAEATIFCGTGGCSPVCLADINNDGMLTSADFTAWIAAFNAGNPAADQNGDGLITPSDFNAWIVNFNAGCP
ncbi:MAG TPA: hypothetical protein ENJ00_08165 [Phycisphaerales bacterium]|nr:hypothetical protein [Phycisphaerales bacterium]